MCDRAGGAGEGQGPVGEASRPGSGSISRLASSSTEQRRESISVAEQHRREGSEGSTDGLLLSVSALAGSGGKGRRNETTAKEPRCKNCDSIVMGQEASVEEEGEVEGEEKEEEGRSVDKVQLDKLQAELKALRVQLEAKEEQVAKLSKIRDEVEAELEELTASLFQEAHRMVAEEMAKRAHAEKALAESDMKVDGLETEVSALKTLVITSTPSMPNRHLHPHLRRGRGGSASGRGGGGGGSESESGPPSPAREGHSSLGSLQGEEEKEETCVDPVLRAEYVTWKRSPSMEPSCQFLSRIYREDVTPCLDFPVVELADRVRRAVQDNTLCLVPIKADTEANPRNCALLDQPVTSRYRLKLNMEEMEEGFLISQLARNRIAAVCDFLTYCRYVTQGMVKSSTNDVYWEVMGLRRRMACARLGFES